jgi:hypothetical protein
LKVIWDWTQQNSNGIGVILSLFGIILSLAGFYLLWIQTKKAQNSADAARIATERAIRAIVESDTVADLATISSELKRVQVALHGGRFETALLQAQVLRERLYQLRSRTGFTSDEKKTQIQSMVTFLRKLQDSLEKKLEEPGFQVSVRAANGKISDCVTDISVWIEEVRFLIRGDER